MFQRAGKILTDGLADDRLSFAVNGFAIAADQIVPGGSGSPRARRR